jgi:hypothetical protein
VGYHGVGKVVPFYSPDICGRRGSYMKVFVCDTLNKKISIEAIFNRSGLTANIEIKELNTMLGLYGGEDLDVIFNTVIFISKWEIWKIRNKVKYNQSRIGDQTIFNTWKNNLKKHLQCTLQTSHINENDKNKLEL